MKALSIRQPWAWAILHGGKDIENRNWTDTNWGINFRGPFLIHAAQGMSRREVFVFQTALGMIAPDLECPDTKSLPRGGIVGTAEVVDAVHQHGSPWFFGPIGFVLKNARPLPFAPLKGQLGFFDVPDSFWQHAA